MCVQIQMSSRDKMFAGTDDKIALKRIMLEKLDDHLQIQASFQFSFFKFAQLLLIDWIFKYEKKSHRVTWYWLTNM